ncbi:hypothetical protein D3C81_1006490 [compost metagenome]
MGEAAFAQQLTDTGAGNTFAVQVHRLDLAGDKTQLRPHGPQQRDVAATAVAEMELGADPHFTRAEPADQHVAHEVLGGGGGHLGIEAQQADAVHAQLAQGGDLVAGQHQARRWIVLGEELTRQRLERQRHDRNPEHAGAVNRVAHQRPVAQVQAVESTDADHASLREQHPAFDVSKKPAHSIRMRPIRAGSVMYSRAV